ncbi:MAG: 2-dehydro-3-deoxyglucarate aldolase [Gammaproteobacteria bacterium]|nr:2-dehydro-3-deoxyglucarate aldolase [Gammaproteobacteria bacterium]
MESNPFKSRLADALAAAPAATAGRAPMLGTWLMSAAPAAAEALGHCGFDFLVVDMEHSPIDLGETIGLLRAIAGTPSEPLVRIAWNDQVLVKRVLDAGARNVMFPFVQNADEAAAAVSYTRYPPQGVRGVAAMHRGSRYGQVKDYLRRANDQIAVVIQLETPEAIERLPAIAAVPGVDSLFLGPGDLSAAMGRIGAIGDPEVQAMIARAARDAHAAGRPIGIVGAHPAQVATYLEYGYDWVAVASDLAMLTGRAGEFVAAVRGQSAVSGQSAGGGSNAGAAGGPAY